jgi:hypothetical protein
MSPPIPNEEALFMPFYRVYRSGEVAVQAADPEDALDEAVRIFMDKEMEVGEDSGFSFEVVEVSHEENELV